VQKHVLKTLNYKVEFHAHPCTPESTTTEITTTLTTYPKTTTITTTSTETIPFTLPNQRERELINRTPCPNRDCWFYDESQNMCFLKPSGLLADGIQCTDLTCSHNILEFRFWNRLFFPNEIDIG